MGAPYEEGVAVVVDDDGGTKLAICPVFQLLARGAQSLIVHFDSWFAARVHA